MGFSKQIYMQAAAVLRARREKAEKEAEFHKAQFLEKCPQVLEIEREMAKTGLAAVKAVGAGKDAVEVIQKLAKYNLVLQAQRRSLLLVNGFPEMYLKSAYTCAICEDTGTVDG